MERATLSYCDDGLTNWATWPGQDLRISLGSMRTVELLGWYIRPIIKCNKYHQVILQSICSSLCQFSVYEYYYCPTSLPILDVGSFILVILVGGLWYIIVVLLFLFTCEELFIFLVYTQLLLIVPLLWITLFFAYFSVGLFAFWKNSFYEMMYSRH